MRSGSATSGPTGTRKSSDRCSGRLRSRAPCAGEALFVCDERVSRLPNGPPKDSALARSVAAQPSMVHVDEVACTANGRGRLSPYPRNGGGWVGAASVRRRTAPAGARANPTVRRAPAGPPNGLGWQLLLHIRVAEKQKAGSKAGPARKGETVRTRGSPAGRRLRPGWRPRRSAPRGSRPGPAGCWDRPSRAAPVAPPARAASRGCLPGRWQG